MYASFLVTELLYSVFILKKIRYEFTKWVDLEGSEIAFWRGKT